MKKWTFELIVHEGNNEFWEGIQEDGSYRGYATCEEVEDLIKEYIKHSYVNYELTLRKYENDG